MKPVIKTTAVAILVALGVTACNSNDSHDPAPAPTPANDQANTNQNQVEKAKAEAEAKAKEAAEKAKAEAEKAKLAAEKAKAEADAKAKEAAEKAKAEAEKAKLAAEKAKAEADAKAKEAAEKAKAEAEKAKLEAEKAKAEAEKKAAELKAKQEAEAKAKAEAEKKAAELKAKQEAEAKAKAEAEKKAAELKAKQEAEAKAKAEAEKKAAELKAKQEAEKKRLDEELKQKQEAEKEANEWRSVNANITSPKNSYDSYTEVVKAGDYYYDLGRHYVDGYDGTKETVPVHNRTNSGYKLDYYQLAIEDSANPQVLGWHKGEIKSPGINGSEISKVDAKNLIVERTYPEKVDYVFKNTPYATYGAVYNNYDSILFVNYEKASSISDNNYTYQVGEYEVIDGNKTTKIKYNDAVKGAATYKGEVLAHIARRSSVNYQDKVIVANAKTPEVDGTITINANFGPRAEENFASVALDSKALGKVEFAKSRMDLWNTGIRLNSSSTVNGTHIGLESTVVGREANEIVGKISHSNYNGSPKIGDVVSYKAVFAAEKQPK